MTLGGLRSGDIVLCERRGWRFHAVVVERYERELEVEPIDRRVTYHRVKAREVIGIWRKSRAQKWPGRRGRGAGVMTGAINGTTTDERVVVHVKDAVSSILTGRGDVSYQSPPLPPEEAMTLVRLLLGRGGEVTAQEDRWRCPIAGGQRTITLQPLGEFEVLGKGGQTANGHLR